MRYRYIHILAALFLIVGMGVQLLVSYRQASHSVRKQMNLELQVAQEKLLFELYDAYDAVEKMETLVADNIDQPDKLFGDTRRIIRAFPNLFSCYVAFPEYRYPEKGKWFCPCTYRINDELHTIAFGDKQHDYFQRPWYTGAINSGEKGFWSQPYIDNDFSETIFTHSDNMVDKDSNLVCVVALDFSVSWLKRLIEQFKPFDGAICILYSSDGTLLTASDELKEIDPATLTQENWLFSRLTLSPIDIQTVVAVPKRLIWESIRWSILMPFVIFVLGLVVVALLIRRLWRDQKRTIRLEAEKKVLENEMRIANTIQMGILRRHFPQDKRVVMHADLIPMLEVGGDLYDFCLRDNELWFIIGDVSGKGVPAALFMSATVNLFRSALGHLSAPKAIIEEMNIVLSDNNPSITFVTAFVGRLNLQDGRLQFCNAGHLPPLVKDEAGNVTTITMTPNIPIGVDAHYCFEEQECTIEAGAELILYTDGVTEARDCEHQLMGEQHWVEMVKTHTDPMEAVKQFIGKGYPTDDITLMTVRRPK